VRLSSVPALRPEHLGLPIGGGVRRVPGLRREEVAVLAGVSTEWYVRLQKDNAKGVSDEVLHAVATALQLERPASVRPGAGQW
jgi:hypothetical protein